MAHAPVWAEGEYFSLIFEENHANSVSLAWLELHVIIARLIYSYEFLLADEPFDWNANSEMHLLWKKPKLRMKLKQRCK